MQQKHYLDTPKFTGRNVPIEEVAKATGKSACFLREALKKEIIHFGYAFCKDGSKNYTFYCPDKLAWKELGYFNENLEVL